MSLVVHTYYMCIYTCDMTYTHYRAAKKRMATRMGGVQPHFENGSWYMRSPNIYATSSAGAMSQPLAQVSFTHVA